jgi:hypothetical protein
VFCSTQRLVLLQLNALRLQEIPGEEPLGELPQLTKEELQGLDIKELHYKVSLLEDKLRASHPNLSVILEYKQKVIICTVYQYNDRLTQLFTKYKYVVHKNQHCALSLVNIFITNVAPTCFGTYVPSSGNVFVLVST